MQEVKKSHKAGRNKRKSERYRNQKRQEINKARKLCRHLLRSTKKRRWHKNDKVALGALRSLLGAHPLIKHELGKNARDYIQGLS
jgi:hypothetical protein